MASVETTTVEMTYLECVDALCKYMKTEAKKFVEAREIDDDLFEDAEYFDFGDDSFREMGESIESIRSDEVYHYSSFTNSLFGGHTWKYRTKNKMPICNPNAEAFQRMSDYILKTPLLLPEEVVPKNEIIVAWEHCCVSDYFQCENDYVKHTCQQNYIRFYKVEAKKAIHKKLVELRGAQSILEEKIRLHKQEIEILQANHERIETNAKKARLI